MFVRSVEKNRRRARYLSAVETEALGSRGPADKHIKKILSTRGISEACVLMQRGLALNAQRQLNQ